MCRVCIVRRQGGGGGTRAHIARGGCAVWCVRRGMCMCVESVQRKKSYILKCKGRENECVWGEKKKWKRERYASVVLLIDSNRVQRVWMNEWVGESRREEQSGRATGWMGKEPPRATTSHDERAREKHQHEPLMLARPFVPLDATAYYV